MGDTSNVNKAARPAATFDCSDCGKRLPRSAFAKAELNRGGGGCCRDCAQVLKCGGCNGLFAPAKLNARSRCRKCDENAQVEKLLQTPKDEVTHFGIEQALRLDREAEHEILLVCQKCGINERLVLQRILDFHRLPYVTTQNGMHFCELCDMTFGELAVTQGQRVQMSAAPEQIDWKGCPSPRLAFNVGDIYSIAELLKTGNDRWFFRTLVAPPLPAVRTKPMPTERAEIAGFTPPAGQGNISRGSTTPDGEVACTATCNTFESFWAPVDATAQGRQMSPLLEHVSGSAHKAHEADIASGRTSLVSRAALKMARDLGEEPAMALGRFRAGLELLGRFCEPRDVEAAAKLERVRNLNIPVKFLREVLPGRQDFLWITPDELWAAEERYEQRRKRGSRK